MVAHPGEYRRSSYGVNAQDEASDVIEPHAVYDQLAEDPAERRQAYRELFRHAREPGLVDQNRQAKNGNVVLGNDRFSKEI